MNTGFWVAVALPVMDMNDVVLESGYVVGVYNNKPLAEEAVARDGQLHYRDRYSYEINFYEVDE